MHVQNKNVEYTSERSFTGVANRRRKCERQRVSDGAIWNNAIRHECKSDVKSDVRGEMASDGWSERKKQIYFRFICFFFGRRSSSESATEGQRQEASKSSMSTRVAAASDSQAVPLVLVCETNPIR